MYTLAENVLAEYVCTLKGNPNWSDNPVAYKLKMNFKNFVTIGGLETSYIYLQFDIVFT